MTHVTRVTLWHVVPRSSEEAEGAGGGRAAPAARARNAAVLAEALAEGHIEKLRAGHVHPGAQLAWAAGRVAEEVVGAVAPHALPEWARGHRGVHVVAELELEAEDLGREGGGGTRWAGGRTGSKGRRLQHQER